MGSLSTSKLISFDDSKCKRDAVAHRLVRLDHPRRQQEQEINTAARRLLRSENLQRRSEEQVNFLPHNPSHYLNAVTF